MCLCLHRLCRNMSRILWNMTRFLCAVRLRISRWRMTRRPYGQSPAPDVWFFQILNKNVCLSFDLYMAPFRLMRVHLKSKNWAFHVQHMRTPGLRTSGYCEFTAEAAVKTIARTALPPNPKGCFCICKRNAYQSTRAFIIGWVCSVEQYIDGNITVFGSNCLSLTCITFTRIVHGTYLSAISSHSNLCLSHPTGFPL